MDTAQLKQATQPEAVRAALRAHADELAHAAGPAHGGAAGDVRTACYEGHEIVVRTHYEITVDGEPFDVHLSVGNNGRVHYHGLPTRDFTSVIDLVTTAIDIFGDEFADDRAAAPGRHPHDSGGEH